jgi:hypothetical protein
MVGVCAATLVAAFCASTLFADHCAECTYRGIQIGKCDNCGGMTTLRGRFCPACSGKLGLCEECGRTLDPVPFAAGEKIEASTVTLDLKSAKVTDILAEIEKQTGNRMKRGSKINDVVLDGFKADKEGYWQVLDRLCQASGNWYGQQAWSTGGG